MVDQGGKHVDVRNLGCVLLAANGKRMPFRATHFGLKYWMEGDIDVKYSRQWIVSSN